MALTDAIAAGEPGYFASLEAGALTAAIERPRGLKKLSKRPRHTAGFASVDAGTLTIAVERGRGVKTPTTWSRPAADVRLERLGRYPDELRDHVSRPFYRRRTLEQQEGADLLIYPVLE